MSTKERPDEDFEIRILPGLAEGGDHLVYVTRSPVGEAMATMPRDFLSDEVRAYLEAVFQLQAGRDMLQEIGASLFAALFRDDVLLAFERSLDAVGRRGRLRVWLKIGTPQPKEAYSLRGQGEYSLSDVPWELLYHARTQQFLSLSPRLSLIRHVDYPYRPYEAQADGGPLKVLIVLADPLRTLNLPLEAEMIRRGLESLGEENVRLTVVDTATRCEVRAALDGDDYHIFHFAGHGGLRILNSERSYLILEEESDDPTAARFQTEVGQDPIDAPTLSEMVRGRGIRLAVLNTHETALELAPRLVADGIPAAIGIWGNIKDDTAIIFSRSLYAALASGLPLDRATALARQAVTMEPDLGWDSADWPGLVLFMSGRETTLFRVQPQVEPEQVLVEVRRGGVRRETIRFLKEQLETYRRNLERLHAKAADYGGPRYAPLEVQNQIDYMEQQIRVVEKKLADYGVNGVNGWGNG